jgi:hypothetical protein
VDAGRGLSRALGSSLAHVVDAVSRSDSPAGRPHTSHWSLGDCDGGYRLDVTVALHCCGRLGVGASVSFQHAAAAGCSVSSLSWRQLRGMGLPLSRRRLIVGDPLAATGFDGRLLACPPCCHAAAGLWAWTRLSAYCAAAADECVSSLLWCCVRALVLASVSTCRA